MPLASTIKLRRLRSQLRLALACLNKPKLALTSLAQPQPALPSLSQPQLGLRSYGRNYAPNSSVIYDSTGHRIGLALCLRLILFHFKHKILISCMSYLMYKIRQVSKLSALIVVLLRHLTLQPIDIQERCQYLRFINTFDFRGQICIG